jgi:CBS domain-containing protein
MSREEDEAIAMLEWEEECPGPNDLESALANDTLGEVETQLPLVLESSTSLAETIRQMQTEHRACVLLVEAGKLAGIFTERDVLMKLAGREIDLNRTQVAAAMTRDPVTLPVDASVAHALNKMVIEGFRHVPVTDDDMRPLFVISMRNLIEYLGEIYAREVLNVPPDTRSSRFRNREGA